MVWTDERDDFDTSTILYILILSSRCSRCDFCFVVTVADSVAQEKLETVVERVVTRYQASALINRVPLMPPLPSAAVAEVVAAMEAEGDVSTKRKRQ